MTTSLPRLTVTLTVPVSVVRDFRNEHQAMLRDERLPLGKRDGRWAVRVYAKTKLLAELLTTSGVPGVFEDSPSSVEVALRDLFGFRDGDPLPGDEEYTGFTKNQHDVLGALLDTVAGPPATVDDLLRRYFLGEVTHARIAASLHTLIGDGLAQYVTGGPTSMFTATYAITEQGRTVHQEG